MARQVLLAGGSRGIGLAAAAHLSARGDRLWCVSRGRSPHGEWIAADLSAPEGVEAVITRLGAERLDVLLYLGGGWEEGAFTPAYGFARADRAEVDRPRGQPRRAGEARARAAARPAAKRLAAHRADGLALGARKRGFARGGELGVKMRPARRCPGPAARGAGRGGHGHQPGKCRDP